MYLYSSKWQKICLFGLLLSLICLILSLVAYPAIIHVSTLSLCFFLFVLATTRQPEETQTIIAIRYQSLLATFIVLFATLIAFSFVQMLNEEVYINFNSLLIITMFFLTFYHIAFYSQLFFKSKIEELKQNKSTQMIYLIISCVILVGMVWYYL